MPPRAPSARLQSRRAPLLRAGTVVRSPLSRRERHPRIHSIFPLFLFAPPRVRGFRGHPRPLLWRRRSGPRDSAFESTQSLQRDGSGVFLLRRFALWLFIGGFEKNVMGKRVRIARARSGAGRHDDLSIAGQDLMSTQSIFKLTHNRPWYIYSL